MATIKVRPAEGARVVQPGPGGMPIPPDGIEVPDTPFYRRLILTGDLVVVTEEAAETTDEAEGQVVLPGDPEAAAVTDVQDSPKPETGRRRARADQE